MPTLVEQIVLLHRAFDDAQIPHAFGGALALAYYTDEIRATRDIDVNVFVGPDRVDRVFAALPPGVEVDERAWAAVERDGQVRLWWNETPVDLFFDQHPVHERAATWSRTVPFADGEIPILDATALAVFKMMFSRPQDWVDLESMLAARTVDPLEVSSIYASVMGADDERLDRFRDLAGAYGGFGT
jgi:hypothetical protein